MKSFWAFFKKIWITLALVIIAIACGEQAPNIYASTLTISLTYTYSTTSTIDSNNDYPACTSTITTSCVTGFNVYGTTGSTPVLLVNLPNPSSASGTITITGSATLNNPTPGSYQVVATTVYVNAYGSSSESPYSAPATYVIPVPAAVPASLKIPPVPSASFVIKVVQ